MSDLNRGTGHSGGWDDAEQWDAVPTDEIENYDVWIDDYRRRLLRTPFPGRTGNRNQSVLLSLTAVMEQQRERFIEITYPDLARICAADHKTIQKAVKDLRRMGHLRCLGRGKQIKVRPKIDGAKATLWYFCLVDDKLVQDEEAIPVVTPTLSRSLTGDFAHDAFGGRRGIKRTDLSVLRWITENPGSTRYQVGKQSGVSLATAYRAINRLSENQLIRTDDFGRCYPVDDNSENNILCSVVQQKRLYGNMERRVNNAIYFDQDHREATDHFVDQKSVNVGPGSWGMPK